MGTTCGGVTNACCSNEYNVDMNSQVENMGQKNDNDKSKQVIQYYQNQSSSKLKSTRKVVLPQDIDSIMRLPRSDVKRQVIEDMINKVIALIRGHLARCRYKKLKFLNKVTGRKDFTSIDY